MTDEEIAARIVAAVKQVNGKKGANGKTVRLGVGSWGVLYDAYMKQWVPIGISCNCPLASVLLVEQPPNSSMHQAIMNLFDRDGRWVDTFIGAIDVPHADNGTIGYACGMMVRDMLAKEGIVI